MVFIFIALVTIVKFKLMVMVLNSLQMRIRNILNIEVEETFHGEKNEMDYIPSILDINVKGVRKCKRKNIFWSLR